MKKLLAATLIATSLVGGGNLNYTLACPNGNASEEESYVKTVIVNTYKGDDGKYYADVLNMYDLIQISLTEKQYIQLESGDVTAYNKYKNEFIMEFDEHNQEKVMVIRKNENTKEFTIFKG